MMEAAIKPQETKSISIHDIINKPQTTPVEELDTILQQKLKKRNELLHRIQIVRTKREQVNKQSQSLTELKTLWMHRYNQAVSERTRAISQYAQQQMKLDEFQSDYEKLKEVNVLQDIFHIWHRGFAYATINGLRLGMVSTHPIKSKSTAPVIRVQETNLFWNNSSNNSHAVMENSVPWHEINAGLGMIALLMQILQEKLKIYQSKYRIQPRGSSTSVCSRKTSQEFSLFFQPAAFQFFARRNWNAALNILGHCLYEVVKEVERLGTLDESKIWNVPFGVVLDGDWGNERIGVVKVGGLEVAFNGDSVEWTKVMRYIAIDLKLIVAFVAKHIDK